MILQSLPAVMRVGAFEAGVCDFDGWAVVDFSGQDWGMLCVGLGLSCVLVVGGLS